MNARYADDAGTHANQADHQQPIPGPLPVQIVDTAHAIIMISTLVFPAAWPHRLALVLQLTVVSILRPSTY